jgi:hypothetical protein
MTRPAEKALPRRTPNFGWPGSGQVIFDETEKIKQHCVIKRNTDDTMNKHRGGLPGKTVPAVLRDGF